jgi:hypothetical protein
MTGAGAFDFSKFQPGGGAGAFDYSKFMAGASTGGGAGAFDYSKFMAGASTVAPTDAAARSSHKHNTMMLAQTAGEPAVPTGGIAPSPFDLSANFARAKYAGAGSTSGFDMSKFVPAPGAPGGFDWSKFSAGKGSAGTTGGFDWQRMIPSDAPTGKGHSKGAHKHGNELTTMLLPADVSVSADAGKATPSDASASASASQPPFDYHQYIPATGGAGGAGFDWSKFMPSASPTEKPHGAWATCRRVPLVRPLVCTLLAGAQDTRRRRRRRTRLRRPAALSTTRSTWLVRHVASIPR